MEGTYQLLQIPRSKSCHDQNQSSFLVLSVLHRCGSSPYTLIKVIFLLSLDQFPSTIKINSQSLCLPQSKSIPLTLTYIFKCLPCPSSTIQPTASLYGLIWFTHGQTKLIPTHTFRINFLCFPHCPSLHDTGMGFCPTWCPSGALISSHPSLPRFDSIFSLSYSLFQTGSNPRTRAPFFFPFAHTSV